MPGMVSAVDKKTIYVTAGEGTLALLEVQAEGKKRMGTDAFLREMLSSPERFLELMAKPMAERPARHLEWYIKFSVTDGKLMAEHLHRFTTGFLKLRRT